MGVPKFRGGGIVPVERPLWDKFLFRTLGLIHIYQKLLNINFLARVVL